MRPPGHKKLLTEWEGDLSLETALSLLTEKRRQYIIYQLRAETTPVRVADLAERIADAESGELFTPTSNL